jgi:hypothetical protein
MPAPALARNRRSVPEFPDVMKGLAGSAVGGVLFPGRWSALRPEWSLKTAWNWAARPDNSRGGPTVENGTRWVGIDLHRRRSFVTAIDAEGEVALRRRIANDPEAFLELLRDPEGTQVALEARYGWEWLADLLEDAGYELHLAHPLDACDRRGTGENRRVRRRHAGAVVARGAVARGVHRTARGCPSFCV